MKFKIIVFGIFISLILISCDCWVIVNGQVIDSQSKEPIEKVRLEFLNVKSTEIVNTTRTTEEVNRIFTSDSVGNFFMQSDNYGLCPQIEPKIKIWIKGYKTKEFTVSENIPRNDVIIEMEKE